MTLSTGMAASLVALALSVALIVGGAEDRLHRSPAAGSGDTHLVAADGSGDFSSIARAVSAAADGDAILVSPGTYDGSVIVDKDVTIMGDVDDPSAVVVEIADDDAVADLGGSRPRFGFWVQGGDADIGHLTITGPSADVSAIVVTGGDPLVHDVIEDLDAFTGRPYALAHVRGDARGTIRDSTTKAAIWINDTATPVIEDNDIANVIRNEGESAARIIGNRIGAVQVSGAATPWIEDNQIDFANNGGSYADVSVCAVEMTGANAAPTVVSNVVRNAELGICPELTTSAVVEGNRLIDNTTGISLRRTEGEFNDNEISGGETGVRVWISGSPSFSGNSISGTSNTGFFIAAGTSPVLSGNVVCDNARDLVVAPGSDPVIADDNRICDQDPTTE